MFVRERDTSDQLSAYYYIHHEEGITQIGTKYIDVQRA